MTSTRRLFLAPAARRDLRAALRVTLRAWGQLQRDRYEQQLNTAMERLTVFPDIGVRADQFGGGARAPRSGQHVIFYEVDEQYVNVLRVLHVRMDAANQVSASTDSLE
jgi:toxin ParE1/3/4